MDETNLQPEPNVHEHVDETKYQSATNRHKQGDEANLQRGPNWHEQVDETKFNFAANDQNQDHVVNV